MRRVNSIALVTVLLSLTAVPLLLSQEKSDAVFRTETRLVVLHASVMDKDGKLVTDLQKEAFGVFENDVKQDVRLFRREDVPVSMGLVVDNSGSMRDKRRDVEAAALSLVKQSNPDDEVFIVNFNDEAYLDVDFTGDIKKLEEGLTRIDSRGGTAMRDALSMSIDHTLEKAKKDKKVLLVVTDGNDNTSAVTLEKLVQKAIQSEVLIYAVGLLDQEHRREKKRAQRALDTLAAASGGLAYYPKDNEEVEGICDRVAHEIRNQYVIAYSPTNQEQDGSYRRIRVDVKGKGKLSVRTRTGYYAPTAVGMNPVPAPANSLR